jgi:hypothetical protein
MSKYHYPVGIVHIYPAYAHHDTIFIVGNWLALCNLMLMMFKALLRGQSKATVWASDGEGYEIWIKKVESGWDTPVWKNLVSHYQADWISHDGIEPYSLFESKRRSR